MGNTHITKEFIVKIDNALNELRKAFDGLDIAWSGSTSEQQDFCNEILEMDYPFDVSFDELSGEVRTWAGLCKGRLFDALIKIEQNGTDKTELRGDAQKEEK